MTGRRADGLELAGFVSLAACLGIVQFTIFGANLIVIPGILWLVLAIREGRRPDVPAFFWPLVALAAWTLVSSAFSLDPLESVTRSRQLLLYMIVPMTVRLLRGERAMTAINVIIALGAAGALVGIVEYAALGFDDINHRPRGTLGHYMTYSGVLMLVACTAAARLIYYRREWIWPAIAVPALLAALIFTDSRNAWVGTALAIAVLMAIRNAKLLLVLPVAAAVFFFAAPSQFKDRLSSIVDMNNATNRDRVGMIESGIAMVRDHPWFGVGPNMVPCVYPQYRTALAVDPPGPVTLPPNCARLVKSGSVLVAPTRAHLHNVPIQLAAERGLPALALWLWFVAIAGRDLFRQVRRGPAEQVAAVGLAALIAMLAAGLFEHNFGDSEFLTLFLGIISLPFAATMGRGTGARAPGPGA